MMSKQQPSPLSQKKLLRPVTRKNLVTYAIVVVFFVLFQTLTATGNLKFAYQSLLVPICTNVIMAVSLNLVVGVLGELSLGHAGFMCIGAYVGSFFSVVTDIQCAHDAPCLEERCLFRIDGSCGRCMKACPVSALTGDGFRRDACLERCTENVPLTGEQICGKCLCAMPCSMRDPSK